MVTASGLRIEMLGGLRVSVDGRETERSAWTRRSARGVISLLALTPGHRLHREQVTLALWPDLDPPAASNNLRKAVHLAHRALGVDPTRATELLRSEKETISLSGDTWVDVDAFRSEAVAARRSRDPAAYAVAIDRYRGDLLPEDRYEGWVMPQLDELRAEYVSLHGERAALLEARGALDEAATALRRALAAAPLEEDLVARLMRVLALEGRRHEAAEVYDRFRAASVDDLGVEPSVQTQRLHAEITASEPLEPEIGSELWARIGDLRMRAGDLTGAAAAFGSAISTSAPDAEARSSLHLRAAKAHLGAHDAAAAIAHIDSAESLRADEPSIRATIAALRANVAWETGDLDAAERLALDALELAEGTGTDAVAAANEAYAIVCHFRGAWRDGLRAEIDRLGRLPDDDTSLESVFDIHHCIGQYHLYGDGLWEHVEDYARGTIDRAEELGAVRAQAFAWCLLGESLLLRARFEEAEGCLERSGELHASLGQRSGALAWQRLAELSVCRGRVVDAAAPLRRAAAIATISPMAPHLWGRIYATHALAALARGEPGEAAGHARSAARAAARYGDCRTCSALLNPVAAEAHALLGDEAGAVAHAGAAAEVAGTFPSSAWAAMAAWARGSAELAQGDGGRAVGSLLAAADAFDVAGQPYWVERTRARADAVGTPGGSSGNAARTTIGSSGSAARTTIGSSGNAAGTDPA